MVSASLYSPVTSLHKLQGTFPLYRMGRAEFGAAAAAARVQGKQNSSFFNSKDYQRGMFKEGVKSEQQGMILCQ